MKRILLFISIILVSHLIAANKDNNPHVVLFFEINKTIETNYYDKNIDSRLNELLAENTKGSWDSSCKTPISYALHSKSTQQNERFLATVKEKWPKMYEPLFRQFIEMKVKIRNGGPCTTSFLHLLDHLEKNNISYSLILRSFEQDPEPLMKYLMRLRDIPFVQPLKFSGGVLEDDTTHIYDMHTIYEIFKHSQALGIRDDMDAWLSHGKKKEYGKPFPINLEETDNVIFCFFDPNINENPKGTESSVTLVDVHTNAFIDTKWALRKKMIIKVNPVEAILNDNYFIEKLDEAKEAQFNK